MRKLMSLATAVVMSFALVACGSEAVEPEVEVQEEVVEEEVVEEEVVEEEVVEEEVVEEEVTEEVIGDSELLAIVDAIKSAYGEAYYPNAVVEAPQIEEWYGLTADMYEEIFVEIPMISAQSDMLMAIKVTPEQQEEVLALVTAYRDTLVNDMHQYPANQLKLQASQIIEHEGYIFYVSLGEIPEELDEEAVIEAAKEQNAIAEEVIAGMLQ